MAVGGPARLRWSKDARFAIAGTQRGEIICLADDGRLRWREFAFFFWGCDLEAA